ncbi:hypothetical protein PpBr36_04540 [Pyricularia pennisetigena]|uniref:hypothetical protein n=1 Tax=Pyricularia pennisetigena TaxID=1578925 RepID=UPI00115054CE|nr:hypothetical protein PpBr36_04540 [Pyricularia pennisetigena]TLS26280.1 hypothetical protein PpBr36_04540 [Pyricularia pennisetigena]
MRRRRDPCMFALNSNLGPLTDDVVAVEPMCDPPAAPDVACNPPPAPLLDEAVIASLVKRSLMALSCIRGGSWMWTSGSRTLGCMIVSTVSGCSTRTGMSWVMTFSRSRFIVSSRDSCMKEASSANGSSNPPPALDLPYPPKPPPVPPWFGGFVVVRMVMDRSGIPFFLRAKGQLEIDGVIRLG